jgi:hypothetical protein
MKNLTRLGAVAIVALAIVALTLPANAVCPPPARTISSGGLSLYTPGFPFTPTASAACPDPGSSPYPCGGPVSYNLRGLFFSFGATGANSGALSGSAYFGEAASEWLNVGYFYNGTTYPGYIGGGTANWTNPGTVGCVDNDGTGPGFDASQCLFILATDDDGRGNGFLSLLSVGPNANANYDYSTHDLTLGAIPKPNITGSVRNGALSVDLTVVVPPPVAGVDLRCQQAQLANARYKIYSRDTPRGVALADDSRDRSLWNLEGAPVPVGQPSSVNVACGGTDRDFYLCATLEFPHGNGTFFELDYCSENATRVECGPNVAMPVEPRRPARPSNSEVRTPARGGR